MSAPRFEFLEGVAETNHRRRHLERHGDDWDINDSPMSDYSRRANFNNDPNYLLTIIEQRIGHREDNVGLDIGAGSSARALRDLLGSGVLRRALATNFADQRDDEALHDDRLDHVSGNLVSREPWEEINKWQEAHAPDGFALIMHRPLAGLQKLPYQTYQGAAHYLADSLRPGGLMFTQVPRDLIIRRTGLAFIYFSILKRPDVEQVIKSPPVDGLPILSDDHDSYAIILKRETP